MRCKKKNQQIKKKKRKMMNEEEEVKDVPCVNVFPIKPGSCDSKPVFSEHHSLDKPLNSVSHKWQQWINHSHFLWKQLMFGEINKVQAFISCPKEQAALTKNKTNSRTNADADLICRIMLNGWAVVNPVPEPALADSCPSLRLNDWSQIWLLWRGKRAKLTSHR